MKGSVRDIDREVRALLRQPIDESSMDEAIDRVRLRVLEEMTDARRPVRGARGALGRLRPARVAVTCAIVAAAVCAAALVGPLAGSDDGSSALPLLGADANAAEALSWAGQVLTEEGTAVGGSGSVMHGVRVTRLNGDVSHVVEWWLDASGSKFSVTDVEDHRPDDGPVRVTTDVFDGTVERVRTYTGTGAPLTWSAQGISNNLDYRGGRVATDALIGPDLSRAPDADVPISSGRGRYEGEPLRIAATMTLEAGTQRWVDAVMATTSERVVLDATRNFLGTTRGYFLVDQFASVDDDATTIRQLAYLLSVVPVSPTAAAHLYERLANSDSLQRLPDVDVDGRSSLRIRFASPLVVTGDTVAAQRAREVASRAEVVLVIDRATGEPVALESLDRRVRTRLGTGSRVASTTSSRTICAEVAAFVPCSLLDGSHEAARTANDLATSAIGVELAAASNRPRVPYTIDADGRPIDANGHVVTNPVLDPAGRPVPILPWQPLRQ